MYKRQELGLPFSFADFFGNTSEYGPQIVELYRSNFKASKYLQEPQVNVSLQVMCASTEKEAKLIGLPSSFNKIFMRLGISTNGFLPPEEAAAWPLDDRARAYMEYETKSWIDGNPDQVKEGILKAAEKYQTGDIGVVSNCYSFESRKKSYELVASCFSPVSTT